MQGIHRSPVNSPHKGQWRGALVFSLICACINGWVNIHEAGDLKRHRTLYNVLWWLMGTLIQYDKYDRIHKLPNILPTPADTWRNNNVTKKRRPSHDVTIARVYIRSIWLSQFDISQINADIFNLTTNHFRASQFHNHMINMTMIHYHICLSLLCAWYDKTKTHIILALKNFIFDTFFHLYRLIFACNLVASSQSNRHSWCV